MSDNLSTLIAILVSVLVLTITPAYRNAEVIDRQRLHMVNTITQDFVTNVRHKGYIDNKMYLDFMRKLDVTGLIYDVEIVATKKNYYPLRPGDTGYDPLSPSFYVYDVKYPTKTILNKIFNTPDHIYKLHAGDSIYVTVSNKSLSNYMLFRSFLASSPNSASIFTQYGGQILNEDY